MKKGNYIFVYGTLRRGERADLSRSQNEFGVSFVTEDKINGEIYDLGSYPGVKTEAGHFDPGKPSVVGEIFEILDESITAFLDAYEGYPNLYNRFETETADGRTAWVYTYNAPIPSSRLIISGDWQNHIKMAA